MSLHCCTMNFHFYHTFILIFTVVIWMFSFLVVNVLSTVREWCLLIIYEQNCIKHPTLNGTCTLPTMIYIPTLVQFTYHPSQVHRGGWWIVHLVWGSLSHPLPSPAQLLTLSKWSHWVSIQAGEMVCDCTLQETNWMWSQTWMYEVTPGRNNSSYY